MTPSCAYYNENDPFAAAWLRSLIAAGHSAPGDVDERSIADVEPSDLTRYTQHHFFAGIGGWSYALRLAGWPDDRPIWTGSCPCQPFSAAGQQRGFDDARHIWPVWHRLIRESRPDVIFGEQVASAGQWLDLVSGDLEGEGYTFGTAVLGAHSVGAPHIRQRIYWVADRAASRRPPAGEHDGGSSLLPARSAERCGAGELALPDGRHSCAERQQRSGQQRQQPEDGGAGLILGQSAKGRRGSRRTSETLSGEETCGATQRPEFADSRSMVLPPLEQAGLPGRAREPRSAVCHSLLPRLEGHAGDVDHGDQPGRYDSQSHGPTPSAGFWSDPDWLLCIDGKARPVEPGTFPLAHGVSRRVGRLRGYGNAIVPQVAAAFIEAYLEVQAEAEASSADANEIPVLNLTQEEETAMTPT